jgi:hypothetical protein
VKYGPLRLQVTDNRAMLSSTSAKDRTEEFNKILERLRKSQVRVMPSCGPFADRQEGARLSVTLVKSPSACKESGPCDAGQRLTHRVTEIFYFFDGVAFLGTMLGSSYQGARKPLYVHSALWACAQHLHLHSAGCFQAFLHPVPRALTTIRLQGSSTSTQAQSSGVD